ncbi:MAG: T9SS type A sorting domain-containing protein [Bacteroidetes bacterium]|nr:T9SS type A sorting domain-containing protein [Bacteroidota bacterium]
MKTIVPLFVFTILSFSQLSYGQSCSPQGNQTSYGTSNVWRGYVYDNIDFTSYKGYVTEGTSSNPDFDESFGGSNTSYSTHNCSIQTETFSIRYKLSKSFSNGDYEFTVGGDDGYRLSLDGGANWVIDKWNDQSYNTTSYSVHLSGTCNLVLEYYENSGDNRVTFSVQTTCIGSGSTISYGSGDVWIGYLYDGMNFDTYKGTVTEGTSGNAAFNETFGGDNVTYSTNSCGLQTETFSARYRLTKTFTNEYCTFYLGGDDGYRLSLDGGANWVINQWFDQGYASSTYSALMNGTYNMVIEYYENGGSNRINFSYISSIVLPIRLVYFSGTLLQNKVSLNWKISAESNPEHFIIQRSSDGINFIDLARLNDSSMSGSERDYQYTDLNPLNTNSYYRLKMYDRTGLITYSPVVTISQLSKNDIKIYPALSNNNLLYLRSGQWLSNASLTVVDISGKKINELHLGKISQGQQISFSPGKQPLPPGIYIIQLTDDGAWIQSDKIVISH